MTQQHRPIIGVTMGDPAGIGPEIVAKSVARPEVQEAVCPVIIGDRRMIEAAIAGCRLNLQVHAITSPEQGDYRPGVANLIDLANVDMDQFAYGQISAMAGQASVDYAKKALELMEAGQVEGISTAPIHKEAINAAGLPYIGHTEMLADLTESPDTMTMFATGPMRIFFLTRHVPLRQACDMVKREAVLAALRKIHKALRRLGIERPTIAVAGLNPHSGDGGLLGWEEIQEIAPAIADARSEGIECTGPVPADSIFIQAYQGRWDGVLSLYHDQGHIASKALDFKRTVSVTLGLPFVRTSVDHGVAFDIAGRWMADDTSMAESLLVAAQYVRLLGGSARV